MKTKPFNLEEAIRTPNHVIFKRFSSLDSRNTLKLVCKIFPDKDGEYLYLLMDDNTYVSVLRKAAHTVLELYDIGEDTTPILKDFDDLPAFIWLRNLSDPWGLHKAFFPTCRTNTQLEISHSGVEATLLKENVKLGWEYSTDMKTWYKFKFA